MTNPTSYPLAWPAHRPRTRTRQLGKFSYKASDGSWPQTKPVTMARALDRLDGELQRMGAADVVLSTNIETRLDGRPQADRPAPADPGACVYFQLKGKPFALACDTYSKVEQNIAALAAHIEATRAIERHGVASAAETLQAFSALPPPAAAEPPPRPWHEVLQVPTDASEAFIKAAFRVLAAERHPDQGGSADAMAELNRARDEALKAVAARAGE